MSSIAPYEPLWKRYARLLAAGFVGCIPLGILFLVIGGIAHSKVLVTLGALCLIPLVIILGLVVVGSLVVLMPSRVHEFLVDYTPDLPGRSAVIWTITSLVTLVGIGLAALFIWVSVSGGSGDEACIAYRGDCI
jgi:hypothetical protein